MPSDREHANTGQERTAAPCLWMPGLYGTGRTPAARELLAPGIARLWPGLPARLAMGAGGARGYTPGDLPCTEAEMAAWLRDTDAFLAESARDGSAAAQAVIRERARAERGRLCRETGDVDALLADPGRFAARAEEIRRQSRAAAQRELAWVWHQQRALVTIDAMVAEVNAASGRLGAGMGADLDDSLEAVAREFSVPLSGTAGAGGGDGMAAPVPGAGDLAPDWRVVLAAAVALVPGEVTWVAEDAMLDALRERRGEFPFEPDPVLCRSLGLPDGALLVAGCPAQELLGRLAPAGSGSVRVALPGEDWR